MDVQGCPGVDVQVGVDRGGRPGVSRGGRPGRVDRGGRPGVSTGGASFYGVILRCNFTQ